MIGFSSCSLRMARTIFFANRSSPKFFIIEINSPSFSFSRRFAAVVVCELSILMSSGPSFLMLNPRSGVSSWGEETPKSSKSPLIFVTPDCPARSRRFSSEPCTSVVLCLKGRSLSLARSTADRSRSMPSTLIFGPVFLRMNSVCPPSPNVPSTITPSM